MLLAKVGLDVGGEHVTGRTDTLLHHKAAERNDCDLGGTATYVNHHVADRGFDFEPDTEGRCHGLEDEVNVTAAGVLGGVTNGPDFYFRGARRYADHHFEVGGKEAAVLVVYLLYEAADHHFRRVEVGNHAVPEGPDGTDAGIITFVHQFGLLADGDALAAIIVDSNDTGLVEHYLVILVNDGVGSTQIDGQFLV